VTQDSAPSQLDLPLTEPTSEQSAPATQASAPSQPERFPKRNDQGQFVDMSGEIWDPERHATSPDGTPTYTAKGLFRKRRGGPRRGSQPVAQAKPKTDIPSAATPAAEPMKDLDDIFAKWG
jgi:hypothetical protein